MYVINKTAQDVNGNAIAGASCFVYARGTTTIVPITDAAGAPKANPFFSATGGLIQFSAEPGEYDLRVLSGPSDSTIPVSIIGSAGLTDSGLNPDETPQNENLGSAAYTQIDEYSFVFNSVAEMVSSTKLQIGQSARTLGYYSPGDGGGNDYEIVAAESGVDDGGAFVDLTAISGQARGLFVDGCARIEQFGYDGANAANCINNAWNAGFPVKALKKTYVLGGTVYITKNAVLEGVGDGWDCTVFKVADEFAGNAFDTKNFDALIAGDIVEGDPDAGLVCPTGFVLKNFAVRGNKDNYPGGILSVTAGNGIGVRIYGKQFQLENIRINKFANVGLITNLSASGTFKTPFNFEANSKAGKIQDVYIYDTGHENFIFNGPADIWINNVYCGASNNERTSTTLDPSYDSVEMPGIGAHGVVVRKSCEIGWLHAFGNPQGYAFWCEGTEAPAINVRLRFQYLMAESSYGGVHLGSRCRPSGNLLETHANIFGDGSNPHVNLEHGGSAQIANIDIYRDSDEHGSTGLKVAGTAPLSARVKLDHSGFWDGTGHACEINGYGNNIDIISASDAQGLAKDGTNSTGIVFGSTFDYSTISAIIRGCKDGVRFSNAVLNAKLNIIVRDSTESAFVNYSNLNEMVRLNSELAEINTASNGLIKRNKFKGYVEFDNAIAVQQFSSLAHNMIGTPLKKDVQLTAYYNSGSIGIINGLWVSSVDGNNVEVGYKTDGTGAAGNTRVGILIV